MVGARSRQQIKFTRRTEGPCTTLGRPLVRVWFGVPADPSHRRGASTAAFRPLKSLIETGIPRRTMFQTVNAISASEHIGMALEPLLVLLVGVEVVEDDVKLAFRKSRGDAVHEVEKLDAATAF